MDELLNEFIVETNEQIEAVASQLVAFERTPSNFDTITAIYRLIHTIKGTCGFLDLNRLARLSHAAETLISRIRDDRVATPAAVSLILSTVDRIQSILEGLEKTGKEPVQDDSELIAALEGLATVTAPGEDPKAEAPASPEPASDSSPAAKPAAAPASRVSAACSSTSPAAGSPPPSAASSRGAPSGSTSGAAAP